MTDFCKHTASVEHFEHSKPEPPGRYKYNGRKKIAETVYLGSVLSTGKNKKAKRKDNEGKRERNITERERERERTK